jgi:predicted secreted acid phosphatase
MAEEGGMPKFPGDDTRCKITILDEDFPGTLCFEETQLTVNIKQQSLEMKILRLEGSDGRISCTVRTQPCQDTTGLDVKGAQEFHDYVPMQETVVFKQGENEKTVTIQLGA